MKVLLLKEVEHLGRRGRTVSVPDGYARNFLIPRKLATPLTEGAAEYAKRLEADDAKKHEEELKHVRELVGKLAGVSCTITRKAGEDEKLYGSVSSVDIAEALAAQGFEVDRHRIVLEQPIKALGVFTVPIRFSPENEASVKVWIVREGAKAT
jgi:large subunit ribosomal protein L9